MAASSLSLEQTLEEILARRPVLEPVLQAFAPALAAQVELSQTLQSGPSAVQLSLPPMQAERVGQGASILAGQNLDGLENALLKSAQTLLPVLSQRTFLAPHMPALEAWFLRPLIAGGAQANGAGASGADAPHTRRSEKDPRVRLAEARVSGYQEALLRLAGEGDIDPQVLDFVFGFVVAPVFRAVAAKLLDAEGRGSWDEGELWRQGYCPVCGAMPSIGWLDKPALDEKNAYLAGGGGKKHLHCGVCGTNWLCKRGTCPACSEEGNGVMEILRESGASHGERLDWCTKCKSYCPTIDLREREHMPNLEGAAIGMMHLDMVAAKKKLHPVRPSFWNLF
ncbi:formate dehydrogenase accessory protein FdhE [Desulfovibrio sp. OttesenSCG-928-G15]|nr:formate dehydrogenase accessory protein FdhE [Desulfovibrio sp. OttesenSCG-928-G15]